MIRQTLSLTAKHLPLLLVCAIAYLAISQLLDWMIAGESPAIAIGAAEKYRAVDYVVARWLGMMPKAFVSFSLAGFIALRLVSAHSGRPIAVTPALLTILRRAPVFAGLALLSALENGSSVVLLIVRETLHFSDPAQREILVFAGDGAALAYGICGIVFMMIWAVSPQAAAIEKAGFWKALVRSAQLTRSFRVKIFVLWLLSNMLVGAPVYVAWWFSGAVTSPTQSVMVLSPAGLITLAGYGLTCMLVWVSSTVIYQQLRSGEETVDAIEEVFA